MKIKPDKTHGDYGYRWGEVSNRDGERFVVFGVCAADNTLLGEIFVTIPPQGPWGIDIHPERKDATLQHAMELTQCIPVVEQLVSTLDQDEDFQAWLDNPKTNTEQVTWDPIPAPTQRPHIVIHQLLYEGMDATT